ncbi:MAG: CBS domain-containing protein [Gemmatimonadetes bacterium]|nr:CBS domain-containing protein [Gemmatimonadota bacterium]
MARLTEIMTADVKCVSADSTLRELAEFFVEEDVSGAPVLSGRKVVGVVSATDLVEFDAESRAMPAYHGMPESPTEETWAPNEADEPPRFFAEAWGSGAPSVRTRIEAEGPEWNDLEEHTVREVATRQILSLPPDAGVAEAAKLMTETSVHRVLVMEGDALRGLVTTSDIVRAVADRGLGG